MPIAINRVIEHQTGSALFLFEEGGHQFDLFKAFRDGLREKEFFSMANLRN
ncbi:hypothetical protein [Rhizobium leguminosarum]|uniref:hypothetical protein n=1 Tax=Rhizobium leguminosarum TaxID=384 RepID=UPI0024A83B23|nr:hypothetical protein [Rhizobium leguminosarum]MDI5928441.1 hypothetical protein [Rhizobium leguminosarum]